MNRLRVWLSGPTTRVFSVAGGLPGHMRSPGFLALAALSLPTLLVLLASSWHTGGLAADVIAAVVGIAAIGTCVFAPLPLNAARSEQR